MEKQFPEFSAVLFDMDGVIFDTEKVVVACWQEVAKKYGIPHIEDTCRKCLGLNQEATVRIFLDTYGEEFPYVAYKASQSFPRESHRWKPAPDTRNPLSVADRYSEPLPHD